MDVRDQNWLELKDIRGLKYDELDWIPIFGFKFGAEHSEFPEIGHFEEFQEFRGAIIFKNFKRKAEEITNWEKWSDDDFSPYYSDEFRFQESHQFNDAEENRIGFRLAVSQVLSNNESAQVHLYQDFALAYELKFDGETWFRPNSGNEQVVKYIFDNKNEVQRVEVKASYLKEYLKLRGALFRLYHYTGRRFVQKNLPKYDWNEEKTISKLPNDRCSAYIEHIDLHGERLPKVSVFPCSQGNPKNDALDLPTIGNVSKEAVSTLEASSCNRYFAYSRMWRGEWINASDTVNQIRVLGI